MDDASALLAITTIMISRMLHEIFIRNLSVYIQPESQFKRQL